MPTIGPVMLDIQSTKLTGDDKALLKSPLCGGLILFARNFQSAEQVFELCQQIKAVNPNIIIAVDQEGGRVQRFDQGFSRLPALAHLGEMFKQTPDEALKHAAYQGELMALEVQSVGCDISFAPVLDLGHGFSRVIGDRAFSTQPEAIVEIARAYIQGMKSAGMAATAKHFPGHGSIEADSHHEMPVDNRCLTEIESADLVPFKKLKNDYNAVMPAHIVFSQVDPDSAGFSKFWIKQILRGSIGFDGVVFSDDLSMKGAAVAGDFVSRSDAALAAGCDMVLVCNDRSAALSVINGLDSRNIEPLSSNRLERLLMKSEPVGMQTLKQSDRWQFLVEELAKFKSARGM